MTIEQSIEYFEKEYKGSFQNWIQEIMGRNLNYISVSSIGCLNLINVICKESYNIGVFNSLLLNAENIAKHYVENKQFPKIGVIESTIYFGKELNSNLEKLKHLIFECVNKLDVCINKENFEKDFLKGLYLFSFVINEGPLALKAEYQWRISYKFILPESEVRLFVYSISNFINKNSVITNGYSLVGESLNKVKLENIDNWIEYSEGEQEKLYFYKKSNDIKIAIFETNRNSRNYYVPYIFVNKIKPKVVVKVVNEIISNFSENEKELRKGLVKLLNTIGQYSERFLTYYQMFYFLLTKIVLSCFEKDLNISTSISFNSSKIIKIFGLSEENIQVLEAFCKTDWISPKLDRIMNIMFEKSQNTYIDWDAGELELKSSIELYLYQQALEFQKYYQQVRKNEIVKESENPQLLGHTKIRQILSDLEVNSKNIMEVLYYLIILNNKGYIVLEDISEKIDGVSVYISVAKRTNLTLFLLPKDIATMYENFFRFTQFYWRDNNYVDRVETYYKGMIEKVKEEDKKEFEKKVKIMIAFAKEIKKNESIVSPILNWRNIV